MLAIIVITMILALAIASNAAAYRNGVNDGYLAYHEPWNPGYQKAKRFLEKRGIWREKTTDEEVNRELRKQHYGSPTPKRHG